MPLQDQLSRLAAANPVPDRRVPAFVPEHWGEELLTRILAEPRSGRGSTRRARSRARLLLLTAVVLALLVAPTYAVGWDLIDGWLSGEPAPESVVDDFDSYRRELGFHPQPSRAVLVAEGGEMSLYVTTNAEGSYCLLASAPWKRPGKLGEGGTCISTAHARATLIAGLVGASPDTLLIAGRINDPEARTIQFADPAGGVVGRPVGASGFFIAAVRTHGSACANGDWRPTFVASGADGEELARAVITLGRAGSPGVCVFAAPHP